MARSRRVFYHDQQGRQRKNVGWDPITKKSAVVITAAEWLPPSSATSGSIFGLENERPNLGDADIWVSNVGVHGPEGGAGGVEFYLHVDFFRPLGVMVTITVLEEIERFDPA